MADLAQHLRDQLPVIAIFGPTGVGKTSVAIELARLLSGQRLGSEAVSADAMQVYKGLETLTGAADAGEQGKLKHHMLSIVESGVDFDVVQFAQRAHQAIDQIRSEGKLPIVVGGTGLYLRAALCELDFLPPPPPGLRDRLEAEFAERGPEALHAQLESQDPAAAATVDPRNGRRIIRALEAVAVGHSAADRETNRLWTQEVRVPTRLFGLVQDRDTLYSAIDARVDRMVANGAALEVASAERAGAGKTARQALGFDELLAGDVDALKQNTRRYAKRQLTWLRKLPAERLIDVTARRPGEVASEVFARLQGD